MTKVKTLCNRLIAENRVEPYDTIVINIQKQD